MRSAATCVRLYDCAADAAAVIAIGSVAINRLLKEDVSARYSPAAVIVMGLFVLDFWWTIKGWDQPHDHLYNWKEFLSFGRADHLMIDLLGISVFGGMFVVPLYAFLTTTVEKSETAKTVAANNIVNSLAMVVGSLIATALSAGGVPILQQLLLSAAMCLVSAWLAQKLVTAEQAA
mgnify:CR=1 FL=1